MQNPSESKQEKIQLTKIRNDIDKIDIKIQSLISARAECAQKVADIKTKNGTEEAIFYRPEREAQVLKAVKQRNTGLVPDDDMARLFREIMSICLSLEHPIKVAYLGPEGSYSHSSAIKQFGFAAHPVAVSTIEEVFRAVERGDADYGIVPVENSSEGIVKQTQSELIKTSLLINGEIDLAINHCLLSSAYKLASIKKVVAHPQAIGQCESWLKHNLSGIVLESVNSNALAAKMAKQDSTLAAIASKQAGQIYSLNVLEEHIADQKDNTTKFWVIGTENVSSSGDDKTAMVLSISNKSGALLEILSSFASRDISMTRIISLPSNNKKWDYVFFIDVIGHQQDKKLHEALVEVKEKTSFFKLLGSFPVSPLD